MFKALGNEIRLQIFQNILNNPCICSVNQKTKSDDIITQATCVGTIVSEFSFSLPAISRHLKELKNARLIAMNKIANKIYVKPNHETIQTLAECFCGMKK